MTDRNLLWNFAKKITAEVRKLYFRNVRINIYCVEHWKYCLNRLSYEKMVYLITLILIFFTFSTRYVIYSIAGTQENKDNESNKILCGIITAKY